MNIFGYQTGMILMRDKSVDKPRQKARRFYLSVGKPLALFQQTSIYDARTHAREY